MQEYLDLHNAYRAQHNATPLAWSDDLQATAQEYASNCTFANPGGALGAVGTNLAAGTGDFSAAAAVVLFMSDEGDASPRLRQETCRIYGYVCDVAEYNTTQPTFSHFTQVVWKDSTQLGCASAVCDQIFDEPATYHVCLYDPVGNVVGQELSVNICHCSSIIHN